MRRGSYKKFESEILFSFVAYLKLTKYLIVELKLTFTENVELYIIKINLDTERKTFQGEEKIIGIANDTITLDSVGLTISKIKVNNKDCEFNLDTEKHQLKINGSFSGKIEIDIIFSDIVTKALNGLYYSDTESGPFFSTQFEPIGARYAFPCIDNPSHKAEFSITVDIPKDFDAISNMPIDQITENAQRKTIRFMKTPKMSTYLVYIGAGHYDVGKGDYKGKPIYLVTAMGNMKNPTIPIEMARGSLKFYEEYFGINYKLPKLHLIAVPEFAFGAMENWGAITFREILLNLDKSSSVSAIKSADGVIAHELAHQWFGNLVTMKWWNDLWLNESFATFMSFKSVDARHKEWNVYDDFIIPQSSGAYDDSIVTQSGALYADSLRNTHPIDVEVNNPNEITQIIDEITYGKGASVIRMIESFVGETAFRDGVRNYLRENSFSNAQGNDLWTAIEKSSGMGISSVMSAWIKTLGYPVITASKIGNKIHISQKKFRLDGTSDDAIWPIPLTVIREGPRKESILFDKREMYIDGKDFLRFNGDHTGFYRVNYEGELLQLVLSKKHAMSSFDKWGILSDSYAAFISGSSNFETYMNILTNFSRDEDYTVVCEITGQLSNLLLITKDKEKILRFGQDYLSYHQNRLGDRKSDEQVNISVLRGKVNLALVHFDAEFARELGKKFNNYDKIDPDLRLAVATAHAITTNDCESVVEAMKRQNNDEDRVKLIYSMGWLKGKPNYDRIMELVQSEQIKMQDCRTFFVEASKNTEMRKNIAEDLDSLLSLFRKYFAGTGEESRYVGSIIPYVGLTDKSAIEDFVNRNKSPDIIHGIERGVEELTIYQKLNERIS